MGQRVFDFFSLKNRNLVARLTKISQPLIMGLSRQLLIIAGLAANEKLTGICG